ncbi:MAG: membrane protein insertase YidC [Desulfuromonadales bacterium]
MENKNTLIALILILAIWFGYTTLFPPAPVVEKESEVAEQSTLSENEKQTSPSPSRETIRSEEPRGMPSSAGVGEGENIDVVVDTDIYKAVLTSDGGRIKEFTLKKYRETASEDSPLVQLTQEGRSHLYTLKTFGTEGLSLPENASFSYQGDDEDIDLVDGESRDLHFAVTLDSGAVVHKIFTFSADNYFFDVELRYANKGNAPLKGAVGFSLVNRWDESREEGGFNLGAQDFIGPTTFDGEDIHTDDVEDLVEEGPKEYSSAQWTGFGTKYFVSIVEPKQESYDYFRIEKGADYVENRIVSPYTTIEPGSSTSMSYLVYMGPKEIDLLKSAGHDFERIIDFGFFSILSKPLLHFLKFIYSYINNYGFAIILLTVIIKAIFWPLTQKSYTSMKAMQKLQPEMQKVREKYKNDKERLNKELMSLYKEKRVNPLGGCLPMLVQIPVFIALYKVLLFSIELRHAPFIFWLTDLSAKDPYFITPVLMGASMFLQQKMTPTTMDPTQAKIFMIMPVVFTFLFLNFPSGLVIYWLVNNVLTIVQQLLINRKNPVEA